MKTRLSRKLSIIGILFAVFLAVSAMPVTAANIAVVSTHTSDADFNNATLERVEVVGSGTSASVSLAGKYNVSDAFFEHSTDVSSEEGTAARGVEITNSGQSLYVTGDTGFVYQYSLSTAYDISSASFVRSTDVSTNIGSPEAVRFNGDGSKMFIADSSDGTVAEYTLGTEYDISTATFDSEKGVSSTDVTALAFGDSGSVMYVTLGNIGTSTFYTLSTPYDVSTANFDRSMDLSGEVDNPSGATFNDDGSKLFVTGQGDSNVTEYALGTAWDVSSHSLTRTQSLTTNTPSTSDIFFRPNGKALYSVSASSNSVTKYDLDATRGTYTGETHQVKDTVSGFVDLELANATADITWTDSNGTVLNTTSVSSTGNHTLSWGSTDDVSVNVTFEKTDAIHTTELKAEGVSATTNTPQVSNLTPNTTSETVASLPVELSANITDVDFGYSKGDDITAEWYVDGQKRGETTVSSNGTASYTLSAVDAGEHDWYVELTDSFGNTVTSSTGQFATPSQLKLYYEANQTKINETNTTFEVRFFESDGTSTVTELPVNNSSVDMTGLPANKNFVVTINGNNSKFVYRRVFIDSLYETGRIYLATDQANLTQVVYELQDPTGQFPPSDTVLLIERPMDVNGTVQYQRISGDIFGASGRFPTYLQSGTRYRLKVRHLETGEERVLGFYSTYEDTVEPLKIARIQPEPDTSPGGVVYGGLDDSQLAVRYQGDNASVEYRVTNASGGVVVPNTTANGNFAHVYNVSSTGSNTYTVEYTIDYEDGNVTAGSFSDSTVGQIATRFPIDAQVLSLLSWGAIIATMGLLILANVSLAPAGATAVASALTIIGTVAIPAPALGVAGVISALAMFGGNR